MASLAANTLLCKMTAEKKNACRPSVMFRTNGNAILKGGGNREDPYLHTPLLLLLNMLMPFSVGGPAQQQVPVEGVEGSGRKEPRPAVGKAPPAGRRQGNSSSAPCRPRISVEWIIFRYFTEI